MRSLKLAALGMLLAAAAACGRIGSGAPKREVVLGLLQQEAQSLKNDGEKVNPELGVRTTWNVEGVDVREQPQDADRPWAGTIRFKIQSEMKEVDGSKLTNEFEKRFEYVYSVAIKKWIIQYTPPTPRPPGP